MSKATKRKHVTREVLEDLVEPSGEQKIVKVICGRGNNLHEVEGPGGKRYLVSMPTKFRRSVWIKRGDYVIVEPIAEGHKVQAEIVHILYPLQIKHLREEGLWPPEFGGQMSRTGHCNQVQGSTDFNQAVGGEVRGTADDSIESGDDDDSDLFTNTNRPPPLDCETSSSSSSSSSDDDDDDDDGDDESELFTNSDRPPPLNCEASSEDEEENA